MSPANESSLFATRFPSDCFTAQGDPHFNQTGKYLINSDVGGVAVAIANIAINISLPILLQWGPRDKDAATVVIIMLVSQIYPILIATAASMGKGADNDLSLFDAHFAVAVSASPVSVYFAYSAIRDLIGYPNRLFQRITQGRWAIRCLGLALPLLWLAVSLNISFNPHAFSNSELCSQVTFIKWLEYLVVSNFMGVLDVMGRRDLWNDFKGRGGLGAVCLVALWIWAVYLIRHLHDIVSVYRWRSAQYDENEFPAWKKVPRMLWNIISVPWFVVTKSHPWTLFVIIFSLHWSYVLGIARGMVFDGYQLSYGQITSIFATLPPLFSLATVLWDRLGDLKSFFRRLPGQFVVGTKFFVTGTPNPWEATRYYTEMSKPLPELRSIRFLIIVCVIWALSTCGDVIWIMSYVRAGSIPNPRTPPNDPHRAWKPFAISLYIYGYCVCCVNLLVWTTYFGKSHHQRVPPQLPTSYPSRPRSSRWWWALNIVLIPVAFVMSAAPLFGPIMALPLAQQWQWDHQCDSFPGYAILIGSAPESSAAFYFSDPAGAPALTPQYEYSLTTPITRYTKAEFTRTKAPERAPVVFDGHGVTSIAYNLKGQTFLAQCDGMGLGANSTIVVPCGSGNFTISPYLNVTLSTPSSEGPTYLQSVDDEWVFPDDAPSLILRRLISSANGKYEFGDMVFQTAVTRRNYCNTLKVCLASPALDLNTLGPLGIVLWAQNRFTTLCQRPRMYSL